MLSAFDVGLSFVEKLPHRIPW